MWQLGGVWILGMLDGADGCGMEEEEGLLGSGLCVLGKLGSPFKPAHVVAFWWLHECAR